VHIWEGPYAYGTETCPIHILESHKVINSKAMAEEASRIAAGIDKQ